MEITASTGTIMRAAKIMMPCTKSVYVAPRKPPNSVYASVTPPTRSMPVR